MAARKYRKPTQAEIARRQEELDRLTGQITDAVAEFGQSDEWRTFLSFASRFHSYSFRNQVLIWLQNPNARHVTGYKAWQQHGRQVRKGETGLRIFAPVTRKMPYDKTTGQAIDKDEVDKHPSQNVVWKRRMVGVKPTSVFDVSQTDGDPLPEPPTPQLLEGEAPEHLWERLAAIATDNGYTVSREDLAAQGEEANGYTHFTQKRIVVRTDVDDAQAVKTLAHEIGHMLLHAPDSQLRDEALTHRGTAEVEAESVAFMVTNQHGLDSSDYTFSYVGGWAAGDPERVVQSAHNISSAADYVLQRTLDPEQTNEPRATQQQEARSERIRDLAERNVARAQEIRQEDRQPTPEGLSRSRHTAMHREAQDFYAQRMQEPEAEGPRSYLEGRRLSSLTAGGAVVAGYAPAGWTNLTDHLRQRGYEDEEIRAAGLGIATRRGTTVDRFRDRITLPLRDADGEVVAFIGRAPDTRNENVPKYLNSAESPHFHKRETLYGLDQIQRQQSVSRIVVTEGPFDAAAVNEAAREAGRPDVVAVATAGTALTAFHASQLADAANQHGARLVLSFDPDDAGQRATEAAVNLLPPNTHVAPPIGNRDPAEVYQAMGAESLVATIDVARPAQHWQVDRLLENVTHPDTVEGQVNAVRAAAPIIGSAPASDRSALWQAVGEKMGMTPDGLAQTITAVQEESPPAQRNVSPLADASASLADRARNLAQEAASRAPAAADTHASPYYDHQAAQLGSSAQPER